MRLFPASLMLAGLVACAPAPTTLPFFGDGYREVGDLCRRLGESAQTAEYLDHTADLVGCPVGMARLDAFVADSGAVEVFRQDAYVIYTIPRG